MGPDNENTYVFDGPRQNLCIFTSKSGPQRVQIVKPHVFLRAPGRIYAYNMIFASKSKPRTVQIAKTHVFLRVPCRIYTYLRAKQAPMDEKVVLDGSQK